MIDAAVSPAVAPGVPSSIGRVVDAARGLRSREAALRYAAAGIPVLPCLPGGKRPLTAHGLRDATTDAEQLLRWWSRWPTANVGIPTGPVSGIDAVDIDLRPTGSGFPAIAKARAAGLVDGWAALVRTPTGGLHVYYPADSTHPQRCWQAATAHVDFRGAGGYIVAPPSTTAHGSYALIRTSPSSRPVDATALRNLIDPRPATPPPAPSAAAAAAAGADAGRIAAWLTLRREGERNRSLFWAACRLAEVGLPEPDIHAALAAPSSHIGLTETEIAATIGSAIRTTHPTPTTASPRPRLRTCPTEETARVALPSGPGPEWS